MPELKDMSDYVILERNHAKEIANHLHDVQMQMRQMEQPTEVIVKEQSNPSKSNEEKNSAISLPPEPPQNAAKTLITFIFVLLWFCFGLRLLSKL